MVAMLIQIGVGFLLVLAALLGGWWWGHRQMQRELARTGREREQILTAARQEAETLKATKMAEAAKAYKDREEELERRIKRQEEKLERSEARLLKKEERLEQKGLELIRIEKSLKEDFRRIGALIEQGEALLEGERKRLEEISGFSAEQAKELLLRQIEEEAERFFAKRIRQIRERLEAAAEREARKIIATAIQRYAADEIESSTMSHVPLPNEEYKGRVIGKEGRNIRAFEALTGVEVLVDDTPDAISLSGFHPVRREIARLAMEKLLEDGRIHPAQIKKQVDKAKERIGQRIKEEGQKALLELGLDGMHPALVELVGRLSFRVSYGQNQLRHSLEVAFLAGMLAAELGLDAQGQRSAKRAGILHDIGKVVDHKIEGSHSLISAEMARRYGENEEVVHAIAAHNEEVEARTMLAVILQAADALSAARPGARQETFEAYVQRLQNLEAICHNFPGVQEAFAIQAGREVRVIVRPEEVDDDMAAKLSYDIARCIEEQMQYPGEIRVHVVRETSFVETAK